MIFQIGSVNIRISFSFAAFITLMALVCENSIIIYSLLAAVFHEVGHIFFMFITGERPRKIEFTMFGFRIDKKISLSSSYRNEILISLGGIIFNAVFAFICFVTYKIYPYQGLLLLFIVNIIVAAINLFPVSILDGGRAFESLLSCFYDESKSHKLCAYISYIFILMFVLSSILYFIFYGINVSLFTVNIYLIFITLIKKWS